MNAHCRASTKSCVRFDRLLWIHVYGTHKPFRLVGSYRQECEAQVLEASCDGGEMFTRSGVTRKVDVAGRAFDDPSTPQAAVAVKRCPRREVLGRDTAESQLTPRLILPPVQFINFLKAKFSDQLSQPQRAKDGWPIAYEKPAQGSLIEMVVVVMADQDAIDVRQILKEDAGIAMPLRTDPLYRAGAVRPDRIGDEIAAFRLQQHRSVIGEGDTEIASSHDRGRFFSWNRRNEVSPRPNAAVRYPFQEFAEALWRDAGIEESPVLVMFGRFQLLCHRATPPQALIIGLRRQVVFI